MRWLPNIVSTRWFLQEVYPTIRCQVRTSRLYIVGKDPPPDIRKQHDGESVVVTGFVPDVRPWVSKGSVFVVPTRVGSGMRIKVLEALAMGKAVVSTRIGCEGIDGLIDGENIVIADTAEEFAAAVVRLMRDQGLREVLGRAGRKLVTEVYQWNTIGSMFAEVYEQVLLGRSRIGH
jgi:glycosyltransferase involved in cell wall biosynthesis